MISSKCQSFFINKKQELHTGLLKKKEKKLVRSIKEIMIATISSGISNQLRDIYSICRCCWNVAIYKWKVHNGKIEIISFGVKFPS
jgi:hypothetical protein